MERNPLKQPLPVCPAPRKFFGIDTGICGTVCDITPDGFGWSCPTCGLVRGGATLARDRAPRKPPTLRQRAANALSIVAGIAILAAFSVLLFLAFIA